MIRGEDWRFKFASTEIRRNGSRRKQFPAQNEFFATDGSAVFAEVYLWTNKFCETSTFSLDVPVVGIQSHQLRPCRRIDLDGSGFVETQWHANTQHELSWTTPLFDKVKKLRQFRPHFENCGIVPKETRFSTVDLVKI